MNQFYEKLIQKTEKQRAEDRAKSQPESALLEIKDERTIPKLKVKFKQRRKPKWKRR